MKTNALLALCPLAVFLLSGCHTTSVNTVERAQPVAAPQVMADRRVVTDPSLSRRVQIVAVNESEEPSGLLRIQIMVQNTTRKTQSFTYRFEWIDHRGMILDTPASASIPRVIEGGENLLITAIAPHPSAKDFRIKLVETHR
ncbi:MAG TPA: YcfL family protein [Candidatus Paceibacterota bacterium]|nr:YcfL family protein [Verrucomicrobiota bacterium]HRY46960.1 YcfL family protein [Candidatus Paceibacterota bacterium]HSA01080.1 YcfL family protein [Candidatus Paceibacterota bacterium]